jgi:hypothetical protein
VGALQADGPVEARRCGVELDAVLPLPSKFDVLVGSTRRVNPECDMAKQTLQQQWDNAIPTLGKLTEKERLFPGYIFHIRFPKYKNIVPGGQIDFAFPMTALVGENGSSKSALLNALYGAPRGLSTGDFWFSTDVDPIQEGGGSINRYIYAHYNAATKTVVETRKARVQKAGNANYWEPTKEVVSDGMTMRSQSDSVDIDGRASDRWHPVDRKVLYLNFRRSLSAFDQYFYFGREPQLAVLKTKRDLEQGLFATTCFAAAVA